MWFPDGVAKPTPDVGWGSGAILEAYKAMVLWIKHATAWGDAAIHVHAGLLLFCAACLLLRRPIRSGVPLVIVVLAEAANEAIDLVMQRNWSATDTLSDVCHTLAWPIACTLYAIWAHRRTSHVA